MKPVKVAFYCLFTTATQDAYLFKETARQIIGEFFVGHTQQSVPLIGAVFVHIVINSTEAGLSSG